MATIVRGETRPFSERGASGSGPGRIDDDDFGTPKAGVDLRGIMATVRANAPLIAAVIGSALLIALILTLLQTPRYTAQATVQINSQADQVLGQSQEGQQEALNVYDQDRFLQTQIDILESRGLSQRSRSD